MKEFVPTICWKSFVAKNISHANNLVDMGFKGLRIFANLADFPQGKLDRKYIENIMNMQDGMHAWTFEDFPKPFWSGEINEKVKDSFDFCKKYNWLPIVCFGHSEEQSSWLTRSPTKDKWIWLKQMSQQFAMYLYNVYGFKRADCECWNEPNECQDSITYGSIALNIFTGWKSVSPNYKTHVFASNIEQQGYLDVLLANASLMKVTDYISPHILTFDEWDSDLIDVTYNKCTAKGKKVSLLEISPLGNMERLNKIIGKCDMYGLVLIIRNSNVGTAFDIDDFLVYDFDNPDNFIAVTTWKMQWIKDFNKKYATDFIRGEGSMELNKVYENGSKGIGVILIQKCLNADTETDIDVKLVVDGKFGPKTEAAVKGYQDAYNLPITGKVEKNMLAVMIFNEPEIWNFIELSWALGER